jgi:cell division transport system ATP-binding protein
VHDRSAVRRAACRGGNAHVSVGMTRYDLATVGDSESGVIQFENVGLRYGLGPEILRDLSFHIAPRSFQFLSGPSGAGKSSLLRLLFLTLKPTRGLITLFDHDTATLSSDSLAVLRRRIGVVFQDFRLLDHLSTFENVALPLRVIGRREESYYDEVAELLGWVGLGERMWSLPPVLSGGEKQRAAIARAVIARPQLLLADEPTGNVDPQLAQRLLRLFIELNKSGTSVVIATHDIALMDQYDARRLVLHDGHMHVYD